ncbi:unnamed protein product [Rotaria sordida]|uniref:Uncharacterized protein n=1 Tax=Rotaria sordida TaxID=392033 RepID=A0A814D3K0_9BILA|nr:unnamed protein product [Rotaria sordida]CAF0950406.1 unnamed protein product [Rotaria sordida]CAF0951282.1 unnamed protein product [Rotaria sordida]CAF1213694.1 unnamed protein product [Rotaria sordida]CAF1214444.1 unnamed protein product [Rotaria sordida]
MHHYFLANDVYSYLSNNIRQSLSHDISQFIIQVINVTYSKDTTSHWAAQNRMKYCFFEYSHIPVDIIDLSTFQGKLIHSSDYCSSEQAHNKRMILVGA